MAYVAETYEERADLAEHQAAQLETMIYSFIQKTKDIETWDVPGLMELRDAWKAYCAER